MRTIVWNIATRNLEADESIRKSILGTIAPLETPLQSFPSEKLFLQVELDKHPRKNAHTAALTMRLPTEIFYAEKTSEQGAQALEEAVRLLAQQIEQFYASRPEAHANGEPSRPERAAFAPEAQQGGPQRFQDVVRAFIQQNFDRLYQHARRNLHFHELAGDIPPHVIEARDVVAEVARQAEIKGKRKPSGMGWLPWLFHLMHDELQRRLERFTSAAAANVSTDKPIQLPELKGNALQPMEQVVEEAMEPQVIKREDVVADSKAPPPDLVLAEKELLADLQQAIQTWPEPEREIFELYFVQGFEFKQVAQVTGQTLRQVRRAIDSVYCRIRRELVQFEEIKPAI